MSSDKWLEKTVELKDKEKLHLRPTSKIVETASKFDAQMQFTIGEEVWNPKSIMDMLMFSAALVSSSQNSFNVKALGTDAEAAIQGIEELINKGLFD